MTQFLNWDVETGTLADFFELDQPPANSISTTRSFSGTKSIRFISGVSAATGLCTKYGGTSRTIFVRHRWYVDSTTQAAAAGTHLSRFTQDTGEDFGFSHHSVNLDFATNSGEELNIDIHDADASFSDETRHSIVTIPIDQWFKFEILMTLSTSTNSDGVIKIWIDDVLEYSDTAVRFRGAGSTWDQFDTFCLNTNWDANNALWFHDNIELWDEDQSTEAGGGGGSGRLRKMFQQTFSGRSAL